MSLFEGALRPKKTQPGPHPCWVSGSSFVNHPLPKPDKKHALRDHGSFCPRATSSTRSLECDREHIIWVSRPFSRMRTPQKWHACPFPLNTQHKWQPSHELRWNLMFGGCFKNNLPFRREGETHKNMATALASDHCGKWNPLL